MTEKTAKSTNYYSVIKKHLKKQYPSVSEKENAVLCREVIFAPEVYAVKVNDKATQISAIRENLADFIERDSAEKSFIPYSLDAEIADLIESTNCETSSMNEYYRWISATTEIVRNTSDGDVTEQDISERRDFINMAYDREAEILLCLALYEAAGIENNKEKIDMLKFKLARLREMRSIVNNTTDRVKPNKDKLHQYCKYCNELLGFTANNFTDFNLKLSVNINDNTEEEMDDDVSYLDYIKRLILYMMRKLEISYGQNQHSNDDAAIKREDRQETLAISRPHHGKTR